MKILHQDKNIQVEIAGYTAKFIGFVQNKQSIVLQIKGSQFFLYNNPARLVSSFAIDITESDFQKVFNQVKDLEYYNCQELHSIEEYQQKEFAEGEVSIHDDFSIAQASAYHDQLDEMGGGN